MAKLKKGMIFKNYKELCIYMGWKFIGGSTKISNLKKLNNLCTFKREGNAYIITSSKRKPIEPPKQMGGRSIYLPCLEVVLMQYLKKVCSMQKNGILSIGNMELLEEIGLIDPKMQEIFSKDYKPPLADIEIDSRTFSLFKKEIYSTMQSRLNVCLNSMDRRGLIDLQETIIIKTSNGVVRVASSEEEKILEKIKLDVLNQLNVKNLGVVAFLGLNIKYKNLFNKAIAQSTIPYISSHAKGYRIALKGGLKVYPYSKCVCGQISLYRLINLFNDQLQKRGYVLCMSQDKNNFKEIQKLSIKRTNKKVLNEFSEEEIKRDLIDPALYNNLFDAYYPTEEQQATEEIEKLKGIVDLDMWNLLINFYMPQKDLNSIRISNTKDLRQFLKFIKY